MLFNFLGIHQPLFRGSQYRPKKEKQEFAERLFGRKSVAGRIDYEIELNA
jgi:hypothetical protein